MFPKGSRFYENEAKKELQVNQRIEKMTLQRAQITEQQLQKAHTQVKRCWGHGEPSLRTHAQVFPLLVL